MNHAPPSKLLAPVIAAPELVVTGLTASAAVWLRVFQLSSPSLPTGSFAYSNGLETLVEQGHIVDPPSAIEYLTTLLHEALGRLDLPRLLRMHRAWKANDESEAARQSHWLFAARESREIQAQERQMAAAMRRILGEMFPVFVAGDWTPRTYAEAYARVAVTCTMDESVCALGYAYAWGESHVSALARLIPLGPMAAQRVLNAVLRELPESIALAQQLGDDEIGAAAPGLGIASAEHETQHCRLFRS